VSREEAEDFAQKNEMDDIETSADENTRVEEIFIRITKELFKKIKQNLIIIDQSRAPPVVSPKVAPKNWMLTSASVKLFFFFTIIQHFTFIMSISFINI
jgi:hypothetical protein